MGVRIPVDMDSHQNEALNEGKDWCRLRQIRRNKAVACEALQMIKSNSSLYFPRKDMCHSWLDDVANIDTDLHLGIWVLSRLPEYSPRQHGLCDVFVVLRANQRGPIP